MKSSLSVAFLIAVASVVPAKAVAIVPLPSVSISVGGVLQDTSGFDISFNPDTDMGHISGRISTNDFLVSVDVTTSPDPFVLYAIGGSNMTGAPLSFSFTFLTPLVGGPYDQIANSFNGSVTDLNGDGAQTNGIMQLALLNGSNVPAVQLGTFTCAFAPAAPLTNHPCPTGPGFGPVAAPVPSAFYSTLGANLNFTVSALDSTSFNGGVLLDVATVPEPATMALSFLGLALVPFAARRLRRKV